MSKVSPGKSGLMIGLRKSQRRRKDTTAPTRSKYFGKTREDEPVREYSDSDNDTEPDDCEGETRWEDYEHENEDGDEIIMKARKNKRKSSIVLQSAGEKKKKIAKPTIKETASPFRTGGIRVLSGDAPKSHIEYRDDTIHPNTMGFLEELGKNNNRPWFAENEMLYRTAKQDFESFIEKLSQKIVEEIDTTVPELPLKDLIFRIYRDIRFSNDQTPYKTYFSAAWSRTGRKGPYAHYYLQIQPHGKSMIGGGIWHADAQALVFLRRAISKKPSQLKEILLRDGLAKDLLGIKGKVDPQSVVNAFVAKNADDALKTAPKGFPKDHAEIALLRLRSFTVGRSFTDEEVSDSNFLHQSVTLMSKIEPLITYLNSIVMPDINIGTSDDESDV